LLINLINKSKPKTAKQVKITKPVVCQRNRRKIRKNGNRKNKKLNNPDQKYIIQNLGTEAKTSSSSFKNLVKLAI
jgi:hypothetical protein